VDRLIQANVIGDKSIVLSERNGDQEIVIRNSLDIELVNVSCIANALFYNNLDPGEPIPDIDDKQDKVSVIYVHFPLGEGDAYLTTKEWAKKMRCYAPFNWGVEQAEDDNYGGYFKLYPISDYDLEPREKLYISISDLISFGELEKMVYVAVRFTNIPMSDANTLHDTVAVSAEVARDTVNSVSSIKELSVFDTDYLAYFKRRSPLSIMSFSCNRTKVAIGDTVKLSWTIVGDAVTCMLTPGDIPVNKAGSIELEVSSDTTFRLYAIGENEQITRTATVYVEKPVIVSFTDDCVDHKTTYNKPVKLSYQLENCYSAYLNEGIGRLDGNTISVIPKKAKTTYTLSCLGREGLVQKSITIIVTDFLQVNWVGFSRAKNSDGTYTYYINWDVVNCLTITLTTSDSKIRSSNQPSGNISFPSNIPDLKLTLHCTGTGEQKIDRAYEYD